MNKKINKNLLLVIFFLLTFSLGYLLGFEIHGIKIRRLILNSVTANTNPNSEISNVDLKLVNEVLSQLKNNYINKELDYKKITNGMAEGIIESLDDKYTMYLSPQENVDYKDNRSVDLEGIGVILNFNNEFTEIESVLENYPAFKSGIEAGDIVLEVDGEDMKGQKPAYVSNKVKGPSGTKVGIKLFRPEKNETIDKTVERTKIVIENLNYSEKEEGIYEIEISRFMDDSVEEFNQKWDEIVNEVCKDNNKIVLDLRYNPGGFVDSAIYVLEDFLPKGSLLMNEIDRNGNKTSKYSQRNPRCAENDMVVLINDSSASASEIVSGALKDHKRAYLIGNPTVGKGLEQKVIDLSDGSAIHMVFRKWTTPNGFNPTAEDPITPDYVVKIEEGTTNDLYIEKALEHLKN